MKKLLMSACLAALVTACATAQPSAPTPAQCAALRLVPSELRVGDGALDRGFIGSVSLVDVDGDGDLDIYASRGYDTSPGVTTLHLDRSMLYLNDGAGHFSRDEANALSNATEPASGSTWGDVDHDGDLDAFVSTELGRPDAFYRNLGGGRFAREQLGEATSTRGGNFTSSWADIDDDGDLDLVSGGPALEPAEPNLVYRNDGGQFVRVTDTPIANGASNPGAVLWADVDNDGDQDFFVANSDISRMSGLSAGASETSQLYRNEGGWRFTRTAGQGFDEAAYPSLGAAFGDIDNDGDLDLLLAAQPGGDLPNGQHRRFRNQIFRNDGAGAFTRDASFSSPEFSDLASGGVFADFDQDGDLDLIVAGFNAGIFLYANDGAAGFTPVMDAALTGLVTSHASMASGDIDGDGDLDVVVANWGDTPGGKYALVLTNETPTCGQAVRIRLRDAHGAPDPIGARVTLVSRGPHGERRQIREAMGQTTFRAQSGDQLFFGLPAIERPVRLEIRWPGGATQIVQRISTGALNEIRTPQLEPGAAAR